MDSPTNTVRDRLGSLVFSYVANRGALLVAVVSLLALLADPLDAVVGGVVLGVYLLGGYDALYHGLRRRAALGPLTDFVARTVLLLAGVAVVPVVLAALGTGGDATRTLTAFLRPLLGVLLLVGGGLVTLEGLGLLRGRIALFRAEPYVGQSLQGGLVAVQGEAAPAEETDGEREVMTDGGRPLPPDESEDPFAGTDFEPADAATDAGSPSGSDSRTGAGDRGQQFASALFAAVRDGNAVTSSRRSRREASAVDARSPSATGAATTGDSRPIDASMLLDRTADPGSSGHGDADDGIPYVDPAAVDGDPVAVDGDTGRVVVTRGECTPDAWRAAVVDWLVEGFEREHGVDLADDPRALTRLQSVAARTRTDLSRRTRTEILLPFVAEVDGATVHLRRTLVAVGPDGRPRSTPPFGDENPVDYSRHLVNRGRSVSGTDVPGGTVSAAATDTARSATSTTDPDPARTETTDDESGHESPVTTGVDDALQTPTAPHTGTDCAYYRRQRRGKIARPRPLQWLLADPADWLERRTPDGVAVGRRLPVAVGDHDRVPDRVRIPDLPDVYEDDPDEPGVRCLLDDDGSTVPFRVDGFGAVEIDPEGLTTLTPPTAVGTDGPGLWYETRVDPGDEVAILGRAPDGATTVSDAGFGRFVLVRGTVEDLAGALTRAGAARLVVGVPVAAAGTVLAATALPGGATTLLGGSGLLVGAVAVSERERVRSWVSRTASRVGTGAAGSARALATRLSDDESGSPRGSDRRSLAGRLRDRAVGVGRRVLDAVRRRR